MFSHQKQNFQSKTSVWREERNREIQMSRRTEERKRFQTDSKFTQIYIIIIKTNLFLLVIILSKSIIIRLTM